MHTGVTLGIKNMKGCLYRREKIRYHQLVPRDDSESEVKTLDLAISDLATILLPQITVIDGYIGMEGLGPSGGEPIKSDFAVASINALGADIIGCVIMGKDPSLVPHLQLIAERLSEPIQPGQYEVSPGDFSIHAVQFRDPPTDISLHYPDVVLYDQESCSACLSTVMLFLKRFKGDLEAYKSEDGKLRLAIGKGIRREDIEKGTILIGNCVKINDDGFINIKGCPPVATRIYKAITGEEPPENEPDL
jgi:hypothetical protein